MAKTKKKEILDRVHNPEPLEAKMCRLRLHFFGHCMRKDTSLEKDLMVDIASGSRRGLQRKCWIDCILEEAGISFAEVGNDSTAHRERQAAEAPQASIDVWLHACTLHLYFIP